MNREYGSVPHAPHTERAHPHRETLTESSRAENLKLLEGKLAEYRQRFAQAREQLVDASPEQIAQNTSYLDAAYKMLAAEACIQNKTTSEIDEFTIVRQARKLGLPIDLEILTDACRVVEGYITGKKDAAKESPVDLSSEDLIPVDSDGVKLVTDEEFTRDFAEAEKDLEAQDAEHAHVEEWEASRNRDIVGETIAEAQAEAAQAEKSAAKKIGKALGGLGDVLVTTGSTLVNVYEYFREGAEDFAHDTSDALLGTKATDTMKGWWKNMFGKQNADIRHRGVNIDPKTGDVDRFNEHHGGLRDFLTMDITSMGRIWDAFAEIPHAFGARLDEWGSPYVAQEHAELARQVEETAWENRNKVLAALEAEEKFVRAQGLPENNLTEALQRIQDRRDVADADYNDELSKSQEIAPGLLEAAGKGAIWWATRGIPQGVWAAAPDVVNYLFMDGLVKEVGQDFLRGVRQERRSAFEKAKPGVPYSRDISALWGPQERAMGVMERLGEMLGSIGERMREAREDHQETVVEEARNAQRAEGGIYQDAITERIATLTEKTKLTDQDKAEINYLTAKLARVRAGQASADELASAIARAEIFSQRAEAKKQHERALLQYISGRAINTIRSLAIMQGKEGDALIAALQEQPRLKNLRRAEALVLAHTERELRSTAAELLTPEHKARLLQAQETLRDSVNRVTQLYKENLSVTTAELIKALQAANREMKKTAAQAEAQSDERIAA